MNRDNKSGDAALGSTSIGVTVGGAAGVVIGLIAAQVDDKVTRQIYSAVAPVVAVVLSKLVSEWEESLRHWWQDHKHNRAAKKLIGSAQNIINDIDSSDEVKKQAKDALDAARIARVQFHAESLNRIAKPPSAPRKRQNKRAEGGEIK